MQGAEGEMRTRERLCRISQTWECTATYSTCSQLVGLPAGAWQHHLQQSPSHSQRCWLVLPHTHCCQLQMPYHETHGCYQLYKRSSPPDTRLLSALSIM